MEKKEYFDQLNGLYQQARNLLEGVMAHYERREAILEANHNADLRTLREKAERANLDRELQSDDYKQLLMDVEQLREELAEAREHLEHTHSAMAYEFEHGESGDAVNPQCACGHTLIDHDDGTDGHEPGGVCLWDTCTCEAFVPIDSVPCPFCGGDNLKVIQISDMHGNHYAMSCRSCNFYGPMRDTRALAIIAWGQRAQEKEVNP